LEWFPTLQVVMALMAVDMDVGRTGAGVVEVGLCRLDVDML
jgi:hypothetical protein